MRVPPSQISRCGFLTSLLVTKMFAMQTDRWKSFILPQRYCVVSANVAHFRFGPNRKMILRQTPDNSVGERERGEFNMSTKSRAMRSNGSRIALGGNKSTKLAPKQTQSLVRECLHTCTHTMTHARAHLHIHVYMLTRMHVYIRPTDAQHTSTHACMFCTHVCIHVHKHTSPNTSTHALCVQM